MCYMDSVTERASLFQPFRRVTGELSRRWSQGCWIRMHRPAVAQGEPGAPHLPSRGLSLTPDALTRIPGLHTSQRDGCASIKDCNLPTGGRQSPNCLKGTHFQSLAFLFVGAISCALKNWSHSWITAGTTGHQRPLCSKFGTCN